MKRISCRKIYLFPLGSVPNENDPISIFEKILQHGENLQRDVIHPAPREAQQHMWEQRQTKGSAASRMSGRLNRQGDVDFQLKPCL